MAVYDSKIGRLSPCNDRFATTHWSVVLSAGGTRSTEASRSPAILGMPEGLSKLAAHRLRQRYRELLCEEIAQTVADPKEVEEEIRYLFTLSVVTTIPAF